MALNPEPGFSAAGDDILTNKKHIPETWRAGQHRRFDGMKKYSFFTQLESIELGTKYLVPNLTVGG